MSALGPRQIEPDAWRGWIREAFLILRRRPLLFLGWSLALLGMSWVAQQSDWVWFRTAALLFLGPLGLAVFIRLALYADYSRRGHWTEFLPDNRDCMMALGLAAILFALSGFLSAGFVPAIASFERLVTDLGVYRAILPEGVAAPPPLAYARLGPFFVLGGLFGLGVLAALGILLAFGQWFLLPMLVLHRAPLPPAMLASLQAYPLNPVPLSGLIGVLLLAVALLLLSLGWLIPLLQPFFGALLYASYRDVFLGRAESETEAERPIDEEMVAPPSQ